MLIRHVHAENVLAFGDGNSALDLELGRGLTLFVGPNGGGKSSVLRTMEIGIEALAQFGTGKTLSPQHLVHRPLRPNDRMRVALDVDWDTDEEHALWAAFLLAALAPKDNWTMTLPGDTSLGQTQVPFHANRFQEYLWALAHLDFSDAVSGLREQRLIASIDPRTGFAELSSELPLHGAVFEMTRGDYWRRQGSRVTGSRASLAELYVRSLPTDVLEGWMAFWKDGGQLPDLPPFTWDCLGTLRPEEAVTIVPFYGSFSGERVAWPPPVWPLLGLSAGLDPNQIRWGNIVASLLYQGFLRWDRWTTEDPSGWMPGWSVFEHLRLGRLGPALMTLASDGQLGYQQYRQVAKDFYDMTGAKLAYRALQPTPITVDSIEVALDRVRRRLGATRGMGVLDDPIREVPVQAVVGEDIPILYAGSGRVQLAVLLLLLQLRGKVLALDEPEWGLHPTVQAELTRRLAESNTQTLVVTHSPYLVPGGGLEYVRYVSQVIDENGISSRLMPESSMKGGNALAPAVVARNDADAEAVQDAPPINDVLSAATLRRFVREPGDGLWLFARVVVLVEGPNEMAALSVWFDRWLKDQPHRPTTASEGDEAEADRLLISTAQSGVLFWAPGGKTAIMPLARVLDRFGIPWVALFDADVLSDGADENKTVWEAWCRAGFTGCAVEDFARMDFQHRFQLLPAPASPEGTRPQIFLLGQDPSADFEQLSVFTSHLSEARAAVDRGPNIYRWIAEHYDPEGEFDPLFEATKGLRLLQPL